MATIAHAGARNRILPNPGGLLVLVGALTMTGADKVIETWMVDHMPDWLVELTTRL